jgi:hypothetical protein
MIAMKPSSRSPPVPQRLPGLCFSEFLKLFSKPHLAVPEDIHAHAVILEQARLRMFSPNQPFMDLLKVDRNNGN